MFAFFEELGVMVVLLLLEFQVSIFLFASYQID